LTRSWKIGWAHTNRNSESNENLLLAQAIGDDFGDVFDGDFVVFVFAFDAVGEHGHAEGAAGGGDYYDAAFRIGPMISGLSNVEGKDATLAAAGELIQRLK